LVDHDVKKIVARLNAICETWFENRPTKFAKALEMSYENLRQYLTGKSIPGNKMQARLRRIGVVPEWVMYGTGKPPVKGHPDLSMALSTPGAIKEKMFRVRDSVPSNASEFAEAVDLYQPWAVEDLSTADHVFVEVNESMAEGMRPFINPGDRVMIVRRAQFKDGDLVAAHWGHGDGAIKIYRRVDEKVQLWSVSPSVEPVTFSARMVQLYKVVLIRKA
jgi:hypothetical protein